MVTEIQLIARIEFMDSTIDEKQTPTDGIFFKFGEKLIELALVDEPSHTIYKYKEHGPFTTQEAAQEYKDQHLPEEEGWEVKQVSYPTKDKKSRTIWVIRHDLYSEVQA